MANSGVPQIDYSFIGKLPDVWENARTTNRQYQTREALASEEAQRALKEGDFGTLAKIVSPYDQELGAAYLKQGYGSANPYGANLYYGEQVDPNDPTKRKTVLLQPSKKGGVELAPAPEGIDVTPPTGFVRTATGIQPRSLRGGRELQPEIPMNVEEAAEQRETGKRQAELDFTRPKVKTNIEMITAKWGSLEGTINRAKSLAGPASTGLVGAATASIPTSPAFMLRQEIERIQATLAFKELEAMRQASPTGSGLGQISNYEDRLLALINGSLAPGVDEATLKRNLDEIIKVQRELNQIIQREFKNTYGFEWNQEPPPGAGGPRTDYPVQPGQPDPNANLQPNEVPISPVPVAPQQGQPQYIDHGNGVREIRR